MVYSLLLQSVFAACGIFTSLAERFCSSSAFSRACFIFIRDNPSSPSHSASPAPLRVAARRRARQVAALLSTLARQAARAARLGLQETAAACRAAFGLLSLLLRPPSAGGEGDGRAGAAAGRPAEGLGNRDGHGGFTPSGGAPDEGGGPGDDDRWRAGYAVEDFLDYF